MKYFAALPLAASLASAQMSVMSVASAAPAGPATHTVIVGGVKAVSTGTAAVLGYSPESITAAVGDTVEFQFMQKNHTVTQSSFAAPCNAMAGGMDSGFMPNPDGNANVTWSMQVAVATPLWFYCKQDVGTHCAKGMVFAINAATTGDKTFAQYKQLAVNTNGTALTTAAIQSVGAGAQAAPTTVTIAAGSGTTDAASAASVVAGTGTDSTGNACACQCLCGVNAFPQAAAANNFGGFAGMLPAGTSAAAAAVTSAPAA